MEENLAELTTRLQYLTIQQDKVNIRVIHTRREVATMTTAIRDRAIETTTPPTTSERVKAVVDSGYHVGDEVTIINPTPGQESHGVIIGETKDGLLKIKPTVGKYIKRLPKNKYEDERH